MSGEHSVTELHPHPPFTSLMLGPAKWKSHEETTTKVEIKDKRGQEGREGEREERRNNKERKGEKFYL